MDEVLPLPPRRRPPLLRVCLHQPPGYFLRRGHIVYDCGGMPIGSKPKRILVRFDGKSALTHIHMFVVLFTPYTTSGLHCSSCPMDSG